jgi:AI-2 transport protein TqsA
MPVRSGSHTFSTLAALVVIVAGLKLAAPLVVPLLVAMLLAAASAPIAACLTSRGYGATLAALVALLVDVAFLGGVAIVFVLCLTEVRMDAPAHWDHVARLANVGSRWLEQHHVAGAHAALGQLYDRDHVLGVVGSMVTTLSDGVSNGVVLLLLVFFALFESAGIGDKLRRTLPNPRDNVARCESAVREVQQYLLVKAALGLVGAVLIGLWLAAWHVDLPVLLAVIAFVAHFVPNIGSVVGAVPGVAVALLDRGSGSALAVAAGYLFINFSISNVVEPRILGRTMGLSPLVATVSMLAWGWLWGPMGALLAVPLMVIVRVAFENIEGMEWAAIWMGPGSAATPVGSVEATGRASTPIGLGVARAPHVQPAASAALDAIRRAGARIVPRDTPRRGAQTRR